MDELLNVRQLQDILGVDRVTIYRMLEQGQLPGFKVGGQWRFSRQEIEAWLARQRAEMPAVQEGDRTASPLLLSDVTQIIPLSCVRPVLDIFASAMGIAASCVDTRAELLTTFSNPCPFCEQIRAKPEGRERCRRSWRLLLENSYSTTAQRCHAGLCLHVEAVEIQGQRIAWVLAGQYVLGEGEKDAIGSNAPAIARALGLNQEELVETIRHVHVLSPEDEIRVAGLQKKVAATIVEMVDERLHLLSRLKRIADLANIV